MTQKQAKYFPAIGGAMFHYIKKDPEELKIECPALTKSIRFYNDQQKLDPFFYHPYLLLTAGHYYKTTDVRSAVDCPESTELFLDSGGYQLASGQVTEDKFNEKIVLDWCERNGDIYPILDRPSRPGVDLSFTRMKTQAAAAYYQKHRSAEGKKILNVMSGGSLTMMRQAYDDMKGFEFEGWAHGAHNMRMKTILKGLLFLWNQGEFDRDYTTYHHIFGVTRPEVMLYLAYAQRLFNEKSVDVQVTYDSSSFARSMGFGTMFMFNSFTKLGQLSYSNNFDYSKLPPDAVLPCTCPVCSEVPTMRMFLDDVKTYYAIGTLHNLYLQLNHKKIVDQFVTINCDEVLFSGLPTQMVRNLKAMKKAWDNPKQGYAIIDHGFKSNDDIHTHEGANMDEFFTDD